MAAISPFADAATYQPVAMRAHGAVDLPDRFGSVTDEHAAATTGVAVFDRSDRALLAVTGEDRKSWLHGLVTNAVLPLDEGAGTYAFATNAKGRVLFDLSIVALADALWLDLDVQAVPAAAQQLDRHLFTEDARVTEVTGHHARLGFVGPGSDRLAAGLSGGTVKPDQVVGPCRDRRGSPTDGARFRRTHRLRADRAAR